MLKVYGNIQLQGIDYQPEASQLITDFVRADLVEKYGPRMLSLRDSTESFDLAKEIENWPITLDDDFIQKKAPW